jgi:hypothetical protein
MRIRGFRLSLLAVAPVLAAGLLAGPSAGTAAADACQNWNEGQPANPVRGDSVANTLTGTAAAGPCDVWAVGYDQDVDTPGSIRALIEHWTGGSWAVVTPSPPLNTNTRLFGVSAVSASNIWAVGYTFDTAANLNRTLILHWDGSTWTRQASPSPARADGALLGVDALSASDVWAVGQSGNGPGETPLALHFDGRRWTQKTVPPPSDGTHQVFSAVSGASGSDVWALGFTSGSPAHPVLYHWDGSKWAPKDFPVPAPGQISGIAAVSAGNVWAAGYLPNGSGHRQTLIMHYNGSGWSQVQQVPNPGGSGFDNSLTGMARSSASDIWASGWYQEGSGGVVPFVLHYDGSTWAAAKLPGARGGEDNIIGAVAVSGPGQAWVAGAFLDNSKTYAAPVPVVPFVTGLTPFSAANTLGLYGLAPSGPPAHTNNCSGLDAGLIVGSSPPGGLREPFGTPVSLTVCDGPALVTVPNVRTFDDASARSEIAGAGLTVGAVSMVPDCTLSPGDVVSQNPLGGTQAPPGTAVSLDESNGKRVDGTPCPVIN